MRRAAEHCLKVIDRVRIRRPARSPASRARAARTIAPIRFGSQDRQRVGQARPAESTSASVIANRRKRQPRADRQPGDQCLDGGGLVQVLGDLLARCRGADPRSVRAGRPGRAGSRRAERPCTAPARCGTPGGARRVARPRPARRSDQAPVPGGGVEADCDETAISVGPSTRTIARRVAQAAELFDDGVRLIRLDQEHRIGQPPHDPPRQRLPGEQLFGKHGSVVRTRVTFLCSLTGIRAVVDVIVSFPKIDRVLPATAPPALGPNRPPSAGRRRSRRDRARRRSDSSRIS